jgi:O-Antigen ligase
VGAVATVEVVPALAPVAATDAGIGAEGLLVLAALAAATVGQGGYYRRVNVVCAVFLALAAAVLFGRRRFTTFRPGVWVLAGLGVMSASTVITGLLAGHLAGALGTTALLTGLAVIVAMVASSTVSARRQLADAVLALGVFLAATAWFGVAFHFTPLGHADGGLWRGATTVTYSNAAAAILGPLALLALARATSRHGWQSRATAVLLLAGLAATLSRAGIASFVAGLVVLAWLVGFGAMWRAARMALLGGLVAAAALMPGMPVASPPKPLWALFGLTAGLVTGVVRWPEVLNRRRRPGRGDRRRRIGWLALPAGLALAVALVGFSGHGAAWSHRLGMSSPDRTSLASVALHMWLNHPFRGVGPGRVLFVWTTADHRLVFDRYAHNEYLQIAVEQGVVGLIGLGALGTAVGATALTGWRSSPRSQSDDGPGADQMLLRAGAIAGLICLALHSAFDFLWHVPAVPMIAAVAVGLTTRGLRTEPLSQPPRPPRTQEIS